MLTRERTSWPTLVPTFWRDLPRDCWPQAQQGAIPDHRRMAMSPQEQANRLALKIPAPCVCTDIPLCNQHKMAAEIIAAALAASAAKMEEMRVDTLHAIDRWQAMTKERDALTAKLEASERALERVRE